MEIKNWGLPYLNIMDDILAQHGLPTELKYLAVIESKLRTSALSHAGAAGPWQFMPATARNYGLKITKYTDERRDYRKSTHAAAKYLKYLYNEFGDWLLVIAAYNGGRATFIMRLKKAGVVISGICNIICLKNPGTTLKKFISTHYIFEGQGGICTLTKAEATEQIGSLAGYLLNRNLTAQELSKARTTTISGKYRAAVIAKYINA